MLTPYCLFFDRVSSWKKIAILYILRMIIMERIMKAFYIGLMFGLVSYAWAKAPANEPGSANPSSMAMIL